MRKVVAIFVNPVVPHVAIVHDNVLQKHVHIEISTNFLVLLFINYMEVLLYTKASKSFLLRTTFC